MEDYFVKVEDCTLEFDPNNDGKVFDDNHECYAMKKRKYTILLQQHPLLELWGNGMPSVN